MRKREADKAADEADAFARAMADVVRLEPDPRGRIRAAPRISTPPRAPSPGAHSGQPREPGDIDGSDEPFAAPGVDRREIRKLKRSDYVAADRLDLHGMTAAAACASVTQFIQDSRHRHHRCVCIVHGRGLHSEGNRPVLKTRVRECLRSHPSVLAYADAPRSDGGAGAVYVLLRR